MDKAKFYQNIQINGLFKALTSKQVEGFEVLINESVNLPINQLAYIFATVKWETGNTMQPIEEIGKGKGKRYGQKIWYNGKPYNDIDTIFYGKGFTQTTWRDNAVKLTMAAKKLGKGYDLQLWDFEHNTHLYLELEPSAWVTVFAMSTGLYTGRKLSDYINEHECDFLKARRIINGQDRSFEIKEYADNFLKALQ